MHAPVHGHARVHADVHARASTYRHTSHACMFLHWAVAPIRVECTLEKRSKDGISEKYTIIVMAPDRFVNRKEHPHERSYFGGESTYTKQSGSK